MEVKSGASGDGFVLKVQSNQIAIFTEWICN